MTRGYGMAVYCQLGDVEARLIRQLPVLAGVELVA